MAEKKSMTWHCAAKRSAVRPDEAVAVAVDGRQVALCEINGVVHAIDNICTHEYACLADGFVDDDQIECPLHQARFHIPTGKALTPPASVDLRVYAVKIEDDDVYIGIDE